MLQFRCINLYPFQIGNNKSKNLLFGYTKISLLISDCKITNLEINNSIDIHGDNMKVELIVIDSFGIGEMPDANKFGDEGSNTYLNTYKKTGVKLNNLARLGLNSIDGVNLEHEQVVGSFARLQEKTFAKDTTAGHYEMCGLVLKNPYPTFPNGFDQGLLDLLKEKLGVEFLGNIVASGTEIIKELGDEHLRTHKPIAYTSADSVFQIATHIDVYPLEKLYELCQKVRDIFGPDSKYNFGRVIARPFATNDKGEFYRLEARKDYALNPPAPTLIDKLNANKFDTVCIGKIEDIFNFRGISESNHTKNNHDGLHAIIETTKRRDINGLVFANLNDTDMLYGHRNNYVGYADALKEIDEHIPEIVENLDDDDILLITGDHGCDPTTPSTDHSREYVPLVIYGKKLKNNINFGTILGFDIINKSILDLFGIETHKDSIFRKLK